MLLDRSDERISVRDFLSRFALMFFPAALLFTLAIAVYTDADRLP